MSDELHGLLEAVHDRASFVAFVKALANDRRAEIALELEAPSSSYGPGAGGWENVTIEDYLESAASWAEDCQHLGTQFPEEPSWATFARFLYLGKIYE
jgi:hypothetical protein